MPFNVLRIFLYDSAPGIALCLLVSLPVTILLIGSNNVLLLALIMSVLANTVFILCSGIDGLHLLSTGYTASYELSVLIFVVGSFLISLFEAPIFLPFFMLAYGLALMGIIEYS